MNKKRSTTELQRPSVSAYLEREKFPIVVILDHIRSLSNVGSIFRTADAFQVEQLVLCGITGKPPHREIQRTALGATESVQWSYEEDAVKAVELWQRKGYKVLALEQCEEHIWPQQWAAHFAGPICLVLGNEVDGVQQRVIDRCDGVIEIPQLGTKHSLNVTIAAGIALWEIFKYFIERKD
jgi:23S rRNA (guanosine2251-2'-O)-methyltransferase